MHAHMMDYINCEQQSLHVEEERKGERWPRHESLALLTIRAKMDSRFRQSAQKSLLWDELSRIMEEEYGYKRSGRKCREKLDNLYKYYKKTKKNKDGCNYRFFRQLDALFGDQDNNHLPDFAANTNSKHLFYKRLDLSSFSDSSDSDSSSSEDEDSILDELIETETKKLVQVQEAWLDKMLNSIDRIDQERIFKEDLRRREKDERFEIEIRVWRDDQEQIKARDDVILEVLERVRDKGLRFPCNN